MKGTLFNDLENLNKALMKLKREGLLLAKETMKYTFTERMIFSFIKALLLWSIIIAIAIMNKGGTLWTKPSEVGIHGSICLLILVFIFAYQVMTDNSTKH